MGLDAQAPHHPSALLCPLRVRSLSTALDRQLCTLQVGVGREVLRPPRGGNAYERDIELEVPVRITLTDDSSRSTQVLIDSGSQVLAVAGFGVLPLSLRTQAPHKFALMGVGPNQLQGGYRGHWVSMRLPAVQGDEVTTAYCTDLFIHEADIGPRIILGFPFLARYWFALLPSSKHLVYEECLHACVPHVPLPPVQAMCSRVQGHCRCETPSTAQATIVPASPLSPLPSVPSPPSSSPLSRPLSPARSQAPRLAEIPAPQRTYIYKPRVEGQMPRTGGTRECGGTAARI